MYALAGIYNFLIFNTLKPLNIDAEKDNDKGAESSGFLAVWDAPEYQRSPDGRLFDLPKNEKSAAEIKQIRKNIAIRIWEDYCKYVGIAPWPDR